jgi:hypothetical protein
VTAETEHRPPWPKFVMEYDDDDGDDYSGSAERELCRIGLTCFIKNFTYLLDTVRN